jgi:gliding motility-associated-like protein
MGTSGQTVYDFPAQAGWAIYNVTVTDACGVQVQDIDSTFIVILPAPATDAGPDLDICEGNSVLIGGVPTGPSGSTYLWTEITPGGMAFLNASNIPNPTFTAPSGSSGSYQFIVEVMNGCPGWDTVTITIHPNPNPFIVPPGPIVFCEGDQVVLDAGAGYASYNWSSDWGLSGETNQTIVVTQSGFYVCTVLDQFGCVGVTPPVQVTVKPTPYITIDAAPSATIYEGESVTLNATSDVTSNNSFIWQSDLTLSCDTCQNPIASPLTTTTYYVSLDLDSCVGYASITINVIIPDPFQIPNAFTPNGDGLNDRFYILFHQQGLVVNEFKVFNRWGEKVWDNPTEPWDGNYQGKPQPIGVFVYYFIVDFPDGGKVLAKGNVTLIR